MQRSSLAFSLSLAALGFAAACNRPAPQQQQAAARPGVPTERPLSRPRSSRSVTSGSTRVVDA